MNLILFSKEKGDESGLFILVVVIIDKVDVFNVKLRLRDVKVVIVGNVIFLNV